MAKFYITTAIPYVNAAPHIGHTLEFVQADVIARIHRLMGDDTLLLSGSDENALKNVQAASEKGVPIQEFIDTNAELFASIAKRLNVRFDVFQKGSDRNKHYPASQKLWSLCSAREDIYKKEYEGLYCVGCEAFYAKEDLNENGECFEHPGKKLETVRESNYFFRLSKYQQQLIDLIRQDVIKIIPDFRKKEVLSFLSQPLQDISISRTNERAKNWGVPVPGDDSQRMYVWFDALNIYQSGIGFGWDEKRYTTWWPADVHIIGKGITRFHAVYWPAFLLSAGLPLPKSIFAHGYFTVNGQKMSKTLGNVIDPNTILDEFGTDALRYYLTREIPPFSDGDFSKKRLTELYNADLANGLGNLVARIAKLSSQTDPGVSPITAPTYPALLAREEWTPYAKALTAYRFDEALSCIWEKIRDLDRSLDTHAPWKLSGKEKTAVCESILQPLVECAVLLCPFLPETSDKIIRILAVRPIQPAPILFPRIQENA